MKVKTTQINRKRISWLLEQPLDTKVEILSKHLENSREFIKESAAKLEAFENRDLSEHEFVAVFIDGKYLAKEQMVIVLGVTTSGEKICSDPY